MRKKIVSLHKYFSTPSDALYKKQIINSGIHTIFSLIIKSTSSYKYGATYLIRHSESAILLDWQGGQLIFFFLFFNT